jgi:hypothetical protein
MIAAVVKNGGDGFYFFVPKERGAKVGLIKEKPKPVRN